MAAASDFTSTVPVPYVDATGCHVPAFGGIYGALIADFQARYGQDVVLDNSTMDGQWLGSLALAFFNYATAYLACYNAFSPSTAQGAGLSSVVKVNGIERDAPSYSTVDVVNIGIAGQPITDPAIRDAAGNVWTLPDFTIPFSGAITVTATCSVLGAIAAAAGGTSGQGGFWTIATPQFGWQSVSNPAAASSGAPVERDAALRQRQTTSTELPSVGILDGIEGAILALPNVARARVYDNDAATTDARGIPGHSISAVVDGGDATAIATAIALRKGEAGTYGTASAVVPSGSAQVPRTVYFFRPTEPPIGIVVNVKALAGYTTDVPAAIQAALAAYVNGLGIGDGTLGAIDVGRLYGPALLIGTIFAGTYTITSILVGRDGGTPGVGPVPIAFNEAPQTSAALIQVNAS